MLTPQESVCLKNDTYVVYTESRDDHFPSALTSPLSEVHWRWAEANPDPSLCSCFPVARAEALVVQAGD